MEKSIIKPLVVAMVLLVSFAAQSQNAEVYIGGHYSRPLSLTRSSNFGDRDGTGLFAYSGGGFAMELNSRNMFGLGGSFSFSSFGINEEALRDHLQAGSIDRRGNVNSTQFGFGPVANLPIWEERVYLQLKAYGGFRFIGTPDFTLFNNPRDNRFVTVEYDTNVHFSAHYQLGAAFQFFPTENIGLTFGLDYVGGTVNTIDYKYETDGTKIVDGWDEINQTIDFLNYRVGVVFLF